MLLLETLFAERWFYGPAVWVCVAVGLLAEPVAACVRRHAVGLRPALVTVCVCAVVGGYGLRTVLRNPAWSSNDVLFRTDLAQMPPGKRSAHLCYLVGKGHLRAGELDRAEALLLEAAAIFPDYPDYYVTLGRVYIAAERFDDAVEWLEQALLLERRNTATRQLLEIARSRQRGEDPLASLQAARRAAQDRPDNVEAVRRWAGLAEKIDLGEAAAAYRSLTELTPSDPAAWNGLAYALANSGGLDEAARSTFAFWIAGPTTGKLMATSRPY
ncbi:MAG: tetratricopeptide repeat protein [Planctomycetes bacterium]|nr:tetratricopeptide repeat protein [Planctomycetota bacterium]